MTHKDQCTATCRNFIQRVDYRGKYSIVCFGQRRLEIYTPVEWVPFDDRAERDATYRAACCGNCEKCPKYKY